MPRRIVAALLLGLAGFLVATTSPARSAPAPQVERCVDCAPGATAAQALRGRYVPDDLNAPRDLRGGVWWYRVRWSAPARSLTIDDGVDRATLFAPDGTAQTVGATVAEAHRTVAYGTFGIATIRPGTWVALRVSGAMPLRLAQTGDAPVPVIPLPLALYFGLMAAAALAAFGLALATREGTIGAYGTWLACMLLFESVRYDVAPIMLLPLFAASQTITFYGTLAFALAALVQFARVLLRTPATLPRTDVVLRFAMGALPVLGTIGWLGIRAGVLPLDALDHAWQLSFFFVAAGVGTATVLRVRARSRVALLFACSFGTLFAFSTLYVTGVSLPPLAWIGDYGGELGIAAEAVILAFAIAVRIAEGHRLERAIASAADVLLQVDRRGRIVFSSPNAAVLFARQPLPRTPAAALIADGDDAAARRLALLAARGRRAVGELRVRSHGRVVWCEAAVRAMRRDGRTIAFSISLRDVAERKALEEQLARAAALRVLEPHGIRVEVAAGRATVDGADAELGAREFELLAFLALRADPVSRDTIIDAIWPEADVDAGRNALRVTVTRIRGRLRARDAIIHQIGMYRLGPAIPVDVRTARHALASDDADTVVASATALLRSLPASLLAREWFATYAALLDTLRTRVVARACDLLVTAGRAREGAALAARLVTLDPFDEEGYLAQARALVAAGDDDAARRVAQTCERILREELDTTPSPALTAYRLKRTDHTTPSLE